MKTRVILLSFCFVASIHCIAQDVTLRPLIIQTAEMQKVAILENVGYKTVHDTTLRLDIYSPPAGSFSGDLPVVILNNGIGSLDLPRWRVYRDWARLIASHGMIAVNYQARQNRAVTDGEATIDFLVRNAKKYHIDASKIGMWTCSANVRTGMKLAFEARKQEIKALVAYYGGPDSLSQLRQDMPVLVVRAGLDAQFLNRGIDRFISNALEQDIRIEVINYVEGIHAFDIFLDTDASKQIMLRTAEFLKNNLSAPVAKHEFILTNKNFMWLINHGRIGEAVSEFRKATSKYRSDPTFHPFYNAVIREDVINVNAYTLLQAKRNDDALLLFNLMVETYPTSANAYDGLADAYEALGNKEQALKASGVCLSLLDKDTSLNPSFRERIRDNARGRIARLGK
jgi:dienelactone hydrolase